MVLTDSKRQKPSEGNDEPSSHPKQSKSKGQVNTGQPRPRRSQSSRGSSSRNAGGHRHRGGRDKSAKANLAVTRRGRIQHLNRPLQDGCYIAFDIETTGGNPEKNGITEIFAIRYHQGEIVDTFYTMVNPGVSIPPIVRRMTGITNRMVKDAPRIEAVMPGFVEFIGNDVLVSHNTIGDMKFLRYFSQQVCGTMISNYYLCTHLLVEKLAPQAPDKSLKGLAQFFSIASEDQLHRAEADAYLTLELFKKLLLRMQQKNIPLIVDAIRYQGDYESGMRLGWGIEPAVVDSLPDTAGVFYLYDRSGHVTFLSSAHSLQREVRKLQRLSLLPRQLLKAVLASTELHYDVAETPFSAALKEAEGVHKHRVKFDPANWHQRTANFLYMKQDSESEVRLSTGPLHDEVLVALGPIRGGREVSLLLDQLGQIFAKKVNKKGLKLDQREARLAVNFLYGRQHGDTGLLGRLKHLIESWRQDERFKGIEKQLATLSLPLELHSLEHCSGIIAMASEAGHHHNHWHVYTVANGLPLDSFQLNGDLVQALKAKNLHVELFKTIKLEIFKYRRRSGAISERSSLFINRIFWWAYFGERREDVRILPVDELPKL